MKAAQQQIDSLRRQYEAEVRHNETEFRRQFSEFLQVQKNLSEPILRKRQGDLQVAMERSLAFRKQAETVLKEAEAKLLMLVQERVDAAIRVVAGERGYELVVDTDQQAFPYLAPALSEDATALCAKNSKMRGDENRSVRLWLRRPLCAASNPQDAPIVRLSLSRR